MATAKAMTWEMMISSRSMGNAVAMMWVVDWCVEVRLAQVAVEHVAEPDEVLLPERLVEAELRVQRGPVLRRGVGPEDGDGGVAGQQVDQEEGRDRDEDDDDDEEHDSLGDVTAHVCFLPPFSPTLVPRVAAPTGGWMMLDPDPLVLPCARCQRRFPLSPVARAKSPAVGVVLVVAVGLVLRFWTRSGLWLDEALTVDIARLPLHAIPEALKHDGAPPLYYYLLHFWIGLFGQSNDAVRALSGIIAVLTLPVAWLCGKRFGGRAVAWTTLVLLASAPFAVYYGTEARMYALVILLTGLGFLALQRAIEAPRPGNLIAVAVVAAALLYTQYWSLYLVGVTGLWLLVSIVRDRRHGRCLHRAGARLPRARRRRRPLPALGAHLHLPVAAHGDALGRAAELLRRHQRGHRLHRQPGFDASRPAPTRVACSPSSTSPCSPSPSSGWANPIASSNSTCTPGRARAAPPSSWSAPSSPPLPAASSPAARSRRATPP